MTLIFDLETWFKVTGHLYPKALSCGFKVLCQAEISLSYVKVKAKSSEMLFILI